MSFLDILDVLVAIILQFNYFHYWPYYLFPLQIPVVCLHLEWIYNVFTEFSSKIYQTHTKRNHTCPFLLKNNNPYLDRAAILIIVTPFIL